MVCAYIFSICLIYYRVYEIQIAVYAYQYIVG